MGIEESLTYLQLLCKRQEKSNATLKELLERIDDYILRRIESDKLIIKLLEELKNG